jgi:gamma-glutamyltranspeptidase/glutathione hydrolase
MSQRDQRSASGKNGVVVSVEENATKTGIDILKQGGHAVDAAVAVAFALAVTYPQAGNIGGGGFMLVYPSSGEPVGIDYRETAPAKATADMYVNADSSVNSEVSDYGHLAAGVPGTVRGLETAWKRFGRLPWKKLLEPAIQLADSGFVLKPFHVNQFLLFEKDLKKFTASEKIFFKSNGRPYKEGERWIQKDLARTLRLIADDGADAFYTGSISDSIVADMVRHNGIITKKDLASYQAVIRKPVRGNYRGYDILGMPPPSSGGLTLIEMLNIYENLLPPASGTRNMINIHMLIETMRLAYFDRTRYIGDMDFTDVPVDTFLSKDYARRLFLSINRERALPSLSLTGNVGLFRENRETTHFSIIDKAGNAVSNTYTLEDNFGSKTVIQGAGFLINNEMHDFNIQPYVANHKGWNGFNPNLIQPGKRMLSSMTPTIVVKDGKPFLVTGSPGGRTIINTVLLVITGVIDNNCSLRESIDRARFNHNWMPDTVLVEKNRWKEPALKILRSKGHRIEFVDFLGDAHSIWIDPATGMYYGEADNRRMGWAEGY